MKISITPRLSTNKMPKYIEDAHSQEKREIKNKDPVAVKQLETTALKPPPNTTPRLHKRLVKARPPRKNNAQTFSWPDRRS
jgi:hypothetical protein